MTSKTRRRIVGIGLLLGLAYVVWPFIGGGRQMQDFCQSLAIHAPLADVRQAAGEHGYRLTLLQDGNGIVHDSRSFGRFCRAFCRFLGLLRQLATKLHDFMSGQFANEFGNLVPVVFRGRRQEVERRQTEALGEPRNGLHGNGREAVFDAGKMALGNFGRIGEVSERHVSFEAQFAKASADF